jgi:hypothetical protein
MKFLIILALTLTTQAFAVDICQFNETWDFNEALESEGHQPTKISQNHKRFTFLEKQMIHLTITLQDWLKGSSREEALEIFGDYGRDGEIVYYKIAEKTYAFVHYWPGDNEYGAFFELKKSSYRLVASISDSFIDCK